MSEHLGELTQQVAQQDETILQLRALAAASNHGPARANKTADARTNAAASLGQRADATKALEKKKPSLF